MKTTTKALALLALPLLTACGSSSSDSIVDRAGSFYTPVYTEEAASMYAALTSTGLTGFVGSTDGTVHEIRVRYDEVANIVYVGVDGRPEIVYDGIDVVASNYLEVFNSAGQWAYAYYYDGEPASISFGDETDLYSSGTFGMETRAADLPTAGATYDGVYYVTNYSELSYSYLYGDMSVNVGFDTGVVNGTTEGGYTRYSEGPTVYGTVDGTVSGTISGSRLDAAINVTNGSDMSGNFDMKGAVYGDGGEFITGGVGGTMTTSAGTETMGGSFYLDDGSVGGCGPIC